MSESPSKIARRDFLRLCAATAAGLASGLHLDRADGSSPALGGPPRGEIVTGLDIGRSKICVAVAERFADGTARLLGFGQAPSRGIRHYGITSFEWASRSVREALRDGEAQSNRVCHSVVLALTGAKITPDDGGPTWKDIFRREAICYGDCGDGILRRVTLAECERTAGWRLLRGAGTRIQNSIRCVQDAGVEVERIFFAPVASAEAMLVADQKKLGALVIDMGCGTTDYAVYADGALAMSDSFPVGGANFLNDISLSFDIQSADAVKLLIKEGSVLPAASRLSKSIVTEPSPGIERVVEREMLNAIIHHHVRGAFELVKRRLVNRDIQLETLRAGVHLTGGCSLLLGICELAEEIFGIPASRARLKGISTVGSALEYPQFSCALGLVKITAGIEACDRR